MNFKTLAAFIMVLGIAITLFGGFQYFTNQPEKFNPANSKPGLFGIRDDFGNALQVMERNSIHEVNRKNATKTMIAGAIVLFLGTGVFVSVKKDKSAAQTK